MLVTPPKQGTGNRRRNRLSVVVPVFNEEAGITDCIERLLAEGDTIDEILIVDNNSTDRTASIIKRYAGSHEKVRYIFESRQGVVHARNAGFDASTCEIVGRIDADTRVQSGWATAISEFLGPNSTHCAVAGVTYLFESPFSHIHRFVLDRQIRRGKFNHDRRVLAAAGANMAVKRSAWLKVRKNLSERTDIHEDMDLSICLQKIGLTIGQCSSMRVETSGRRGETHPLVYLKYNRASVSVLRLHNIMNWRLRLLIWLDTMVHTLTWPIYRAYNFEQERFEFRRLFSKSQGRIMPVHQ
ncbi:glycosyltransferase [Rhodococcus qingshengii]|uniref:glycosyltransferase n=1 Tax=Rhodococcus qingshengii TaxID=334542 RepID=UPI0005A6FC44|nr:glycosyltransferase family A protein [Rhodococcus qingshengii]MBW4816803.1 glycosyltransferase [Rhodococcus qingshengii]MCZ4617615.1 glycosyltransferase family A protein [Rhodococcus qingshengii]MYV27297.1 glycosyltransferase [Rhodococcus erythropolis]